ncbi:MAG: MFS transporter [Calditrichota bacterium]
MSNSSFSRRIAEKLPFYYGWISLAIAILAMIATLPGRSVGIGLITEPFIADFGLERTAFTEMIFWATIIGASFALLVGPAIDRFGGRWVLAVVTFLLAGSVIYTSVIESALLLLPLWILTRGLGQSALSATSLTVVGKWFEKRLSFAMGILALLISIGFTIVILSAAAAVDTSGWRSVWGVIANTETTRIP